MLFSLKQLKLDLDPVLVECGAADMIALLLYFRQTPLAAQGIVPQDPTKSHDYP
jgi:hypothetical protein